MNKTEFFQALTLWFVVVIFLQVEPSRDAAGWTEMVAVIGAIGLLYLIPAYLLLVLAGSFLAD